jgi:hypothetical protein
MATDNPLEGYRCRRCGNDDIADDWLRIDAIIGAGPRLHGYSATPEMVTDFYVCPPCATTEWAAGIIAIANSEYRINMWSKTCLILCLRPRIAARVSLTGRYSCPGCAGRATLEDYALAAPRRRFRDIMKGM